jgi:hypothetical protein
MAFFLEAWHALCLEQFITVHMHVIPASVHLHLHLLSAVCTELYRYLAPPWHQVGGLESEALPVKNYCYIRTPDGHRTDTGRTPDGHRTDTGRTPDGQSHNGGSTLPKNSGLDIGKIDAIC